VDHAHPRVVLALVAAHFAGERAGLERGARRRGFKGDLAREDPTGRQAHVRAIQAQADAADHLLQVLLLAQVGVHIGGAGLGAVEARPDTLHERLHIHGRLAGVGLNHRRGVRHLWPSLPMRIHRPRDTYLLWLRHIRDRRRHAIVTHRRDEYHTREIECLFAQYRL
jgi:hypothetical protein